MRLTEIKTVKIAEPCYRSPVYLAWRNRLGAWDYWLFQGKQTKAIDVYSGQTFDPFIDRLSEAQGVTEFLSKDSAEEILLGADDIPIEDVKGISGIFESPKVLMLVDNTPGSYRWITVGVPTGKYTIEETDLNRYSLSFPIRLPSRFNISQ